MKRLRTSFLFFYWAITVLIYLNAQHLHAQQPKDSLIFYENMVSNPQQEDDLIKSYSFFTKQKEYNIKKRDTVSIVFDLIQLARVEYKGGFYYESESSSVNALKLLNKLEETPYNRYLRTCLYTHLGILYREQKNQTKANELYDKALEISESTEDSVILYNNKSNVYKDVEDYSTAKKELLIAYTLTPRLKNELTKSLVLDNLGYVYYKLKENDTALSLMMSALDIRLQSKDTTKAYSSYKNLANYYKKTNINKAKDYALKAYDISKKLNSAYYKKDALSLLISLNNDNYGMEYQKLSDSLDNAEHAQINKFALMKYDLSEKVREAKESELQSQKEKNNRQLYQFMVICLILFLIFSYIILKSKHKKDKIQVVYKTESNISKKIHDEVANDVYHTMTKLQNNSNDKDDLLDDLEKIYNKTRDISKGISDIDVKTNFNDLLYDLLISYKSNEVSIIANNLSKIDWKAIEDIKRLTIYRVLQELMTNMRKHSKASIVLISFNQTQKKLIIDYKDNGIGCDLLKNNGLINAENRMGSIRGNITFESQINNGFKAQIII